MKSFVFALLVLIQPASVFANGLLRTIIIFGNEKTERQTILEMINVPLQTYVNDALVRDVDDRLTHSGLFKSIQVRKTSNPDGTVDLRVLVVEKQLWFAFPVFQAWSKSYSGGAAFGESNLFIPGGGTFFLLQGGNKLSRGFAVLDAKNVFGSNVAIRTWLLGRSDDVPLYNGKAKIGEINMKDVSVEFRPGYQWTNDIQTAVKFGYSYVKYGSSSFVSLSGKKGNDMGIEFQFIYDTLHRREAFLKGTKLQASYEFADSRIGSDFTYHTQEMSWQQAFPLGKYFNYTYALSGRMGDETLPFHREFTLGGASLRGFDDRQFRGDTFISAKQDLLFSLFRHTHFSVFGLGFYDMGLLYLDRDGLARDSFHNGIGGGLRVSLSEILAPVFGLDVGYGLEDKALRIYFALGLVDF